MPFINGRFYANPLLGRAIERARVAEADQIWSEEYSESERQGYLKQAPQPPHHQERSPQQSSDGHWVTINHRRVLLREPQQQSVQSARQQVDNEKAGSATVGDLAKVMANEIGSLSTPKNGDPKELQKAEAALANTLINNANRARPNATAPATGAASPQLAQAMRDAYTARANGGADPVLGRTFYGTSHIPPNRLSSRPIGNGRQTVYSHFGPFRDSTSRLPTYLYIYNDPGHEP